jgi:hypothetical protein
MKRRISSSCERCNLFKMPVVLYGCETWSLTLREEHRLRVFENGAEENIWTEER